VWLAARNGAAAARVAGDYGIAGAIAAVDVTRPGDLLALLRDARPAVTCNLAGYGVDRRETDPALANAINLELVTHLVDLVPRNRDVQWPGLSLLHAGSAAEYGVACGDLVEDGEACPTTVYGQTKLDATRAIEAAVRGGSILAVTARLFTVYGPGEHAGRLLPSILSARTTTGDIPMTTGAQRRDFTYVGDVAEGFVRCAAGSLPGWATINLATGRLHSVREFVEQAASALEIPLTRFRFGAVPHRTDDMAHLPVSTERARGWLEWTPATTIAQGVLASDEFSRRPAVRGAIPASTETAETRHWQGETTENTGDT
jgi:UDP-glucose 4-epimerase